ncbi:hypothetical protein [Methylicorpusculum sp.]|uniref:hypothetical protein n=1 Tax=Methylicorpusculum sp. TaxID=2713644 RepID=UPI002AB8B93A|nr:hypothetical protein [Methylicorpusculum sp.]MDZ4151688.1 hypothetical protein [Methylicorpusculum sp.]
MGLFRSKNITRDIIFLFLLYVAGKTIIERNGIIYKRELYNLYDVHEVDPNFLVQARECTRQIQTTLTLLWPDEQDQHIKPKLIELEKTAQEIAIAYEKNSPALVLLGPIGSVATVLKEKDLEKKLLETINETGAILANLIENKQHITPYYEPAHDIATALHNNKTTLRELKA